jgi:membrane-bound metal-dependent hydrolase YbcI (DUF457 family)
MTPFGHLAGGFLAGRALINRLQMPAEERGTLLAHGALGGVLPDLDTLIHLFRTRSIEFGEDFQHHRWLTHTFPFYWIPAILVWLYARVSGRPRLARKAVVTVGGISAHLLQDTIGAGDGIMLFWPFTRRVFGIFSLGVHGRHWLDAYRKHPVFWIERMIRGAGLGFAILEAINWFRRSRRKKWISLGKG